MLHRFHCCASCIDFGVERTPKGIQAKCIRLGYDTKPSYQFDCWKPTERVKKAMKKTGQR